MFGVAELVAWLFAIVVTMPCAIPFEKPGVGMGEGEGEGEGEGSSGNNTAQPVPQEVRYA